MEYTFNRNLTSLPPSATYMLTQRARELREQGIDIISLSAGEPDFDTPAQASMAGIRAIASGRTHYNVCGGTLPLRERIAQKLWTENQIPCDAGNIAVTPGGKFAVYAVVSTLINPGDAVMVLNPAWVSYVPIIQAVGGTAVNVPLDAGTNYRITEEVLEQYVTDRTKALIINYPNNPTGCILSEEEGHILAGFIQRHGLILISDEIYESIVYDGKKNFSPASIPEITHQVVTLNGFSKSAAMTGWRIGYLCASTPIMKILQTFLQHTITCLPDFTQEAALASFDCLTDLKIMCQSYEQRRNFFVGGLAAIPGISCHMPEGAFYVWAHIDKNNMDSDQLSEFLLEHARVTAVTGSAYGLASEKYVRMSYATSMENLEKALERIREAMQHQV